MMEDREWKKMQDELLKLQRAQIQTLRRIEKIERKLLMVREDDDVSHDLLPVQTAVFPDKPSVDHSDMEPLERKKCVPQSSKDLEFHIGGTWLNRVGVAAVILGVAYFLKYSFENQWIGPTGRVFLGVLAGIAMMFMGEKLRHHYPEYAHGLLGGGSLAMFLSIYAGYLFYHLISPPIAFSFMVLVMVYTVLMAVRHDSLSIGILGIIGAYATPFLIDSADPSLWLLNSYLILITSGVLGVSLYKKWAVFQYLSFIFNQLIFAISWLKVSWLPDVERFLAPSFLFLLINFVLYLSIATIYNIRTGKKATKGDYGLILLNGSLFFAWSSTVLNKTFMTDYMGFYAVFLAFIYVFLGKMAHRLAGEDKGQIYSLFIMAYVLITLSIPIQFSGSYIGIGWLAEAVGLVYMGRILHVSNILYGGMFVLLLGILNTLLELDSIQRSTTFLFNEPSLLFVILLLALLAMLKIMSSWQEKDLLCFYVNGGLKGLLVIMGFIGLSLENHHYFFLQNPANSFISPEQLSLSALWTIYAVGLFMLGIYKKYRYFRYGSLVLLAIVVLKAFFLDLGNLEIVYKIILYIFLGLSLLGISYLYQKKKDTFREGE